MNVKLGYRRVLLEIEGLRLNILHRARLVLKAGGAKWNLAMPARGDTRSSIVRHRLLSESCSAFAGSSTLRFADIARNH